MFDFFIIEFNLKISLGVLWRDKEYFPDIDKRNVSAVLGPIKMTLQKNQSTITTELNNTAIVIFTKKDFKDKHQQACVDTFLALSTTNMNLQDVHNMRNDLREALKDSQE